jgi:hypothetical protein
VQRIYFKAVTHGKRHLRASPLFTTTEMGAGPKSMIVAFLIISGSRVPGHFYL